MKIIINGDNKVFDDGISLQEIITILKIEDKVIYVDFN